MDLQDLKWLAPLVVGAIVLVACLMALWGGKNVIAVVSLGVIGAALCGASVLGKIAYSKDGLIIETVQIGANALDKLQKVVEANTLSIETLAKQLNSAAKISQNLPEKPIELKYWAILGADTEAIGRDALSSKISLDQIKKNNIELFDNLKELGVTAQ